MRCLSVKCHEKCVSLFPIQKLQEERAEAEVDQQWGAPSRRLVVEGGGGLLGELPDQSFADELAAEAKEVKKQQKMELKDLLNALGGEKALKASKHVLYHVHPVPVAKNTNMHRRGGMNASLYRLDTLMGSSRLLLRTSIPYTYTPGVHPKLPWFIWCRLAERARQ